MIAATARIALTQGLLSTQPKSTSDSLSEKARPSSKTQGPFGSTPVPHVSASQSSVKLSHTRPEAPERLDQPTAVKDVSQTVINVQNSHLRTLLPVKGRPLAASFVQSATQQTFECSFLQPAKSMAFSHSRNDFVPCT